MAEGDRPEPLANAEARRLINQWCRQSFFRMRGLGAKMSVEEIIPCTSYTLRLRTQYEDRTVCRTAEPYHGGAVDDNGTPPGPWELDVPRPDEFEERTEKRHVPHTARVHNCLSCNRRGSVTCGPCHGSGRVACSWCNGSGYRQHTDMRMETNAQGQTILRPVTTQVPCSCIGGRVTCSSCNGSGSVTCGDCEGSGRVKQFDLLTVQFRCPRKTKVVDPTKMPDKLLSQTPGELLFNERGTPTVQPRKINAEVDEAVAALLAEAQDVRAEQSRILFQHLQVERVYYQEVQYRYHGSEVKYLWIYGDDQCVYAPGAPRPWLKFVGVAVGVAIAVAAVIALLAYLR